MKPVGNYTYEWKLEGIELPTSSTGGKNLIIGPGTLSPGSNYSATLNVRPTSEGCILSWAKASFTVNIPPSGGSFIISPSQGYPLTTQFSLTFQNWQDNDQVLIPTPVSYTVHSLYWHVEKISLSAAAFESYA